MIRRTIATAALLLLAACGGGSDSEDAGGTSYPKCSSVWVDGKTLPNNYEGCENGDTIEVGVSIECAKGEIFTYEPEGGGFFTTPDGKIVDAGEDYANDPRYIAGGDC